MKGSPIHSAADKLRVFVALCCALALGLAGDALAKPPALRVHHLQVSVANADSLAKWYVDKLGFTIVKRAVAGGTKVVWIDIPGFRIGLAQYPGSTRAEPQKELPPGDVKYQGYKQIHFTAGDVDTAYKTLKAEGITFVMPPTTYDPPGIRLATFTDPEGNVISIYEELNAIDALMPVPK